MDIEKDEVISTVDTRRIITVDAGAEIRTVEYCMMPYGSIQAFDNVVPITAANTINADYDHFINDQATCTQDSIVSCSQNHPGAVGGVKSGTLAGPCKFLTGKKNFRLKGSSVLLDGDLVVTNNGNSEVGSVVHPGRYRPIKGSQIEYAPLKPDPEFEYIEVGTHQLHLKILYPNGKPVLLNTCIVELESRGLMSNHRVTGTKLVNGEGKIFLTKTEFYESDLVFDRAESICYVSKDKKIGYPTHRQIFNISKLERRSPTEAFVEIRILPDAMMKDFSHGKKLNVHDAFKKFTATSLFALAENNSLEEINLQDSFERDTLKTVSPEVGKALSKNESLKVVDISGQYLDRSIMIALATMKNLRSLNLNSTGAGDLVALACFENKNLRHLFLSCNAIEGRTLHELQEHKNLEELWLGSNQIGQHNLDSLAENTSIKSLHLSSNSIDPEGAKALAKMENLEELWIEKNPIGDEGRGALTERWLGLSPYKQLKRCDFDAEEES